MSTIKGDLEQRRPRWRVDSKTALARVIAGTCGIRREVAAQIVTEMMASKDKTVQFETQTILTAKPDLSRTRSTWTARQVTWTGISQHTAYELEREERTEA